MALIGEARRWESPAPPAQDSTRVWVRVAVLQAEVRQQVKGAGGRWDSQRQVWEVRYAQAVALGLAERIIDRGGL